ncbi:hypothetical protein BN946_scf184816.g4 [Trametes cinnabarina]|uniref:Uncharacterized protein n=1 Tax=Pycnoporus cinnabarinus TaxID=5643 RepID=A0A060SJP0_PYCCI|nr:hypothetical protein BN946_scf184816.g4 [Trametes cinnabarina]
MPIYSTTRARRARATCARAPPWWQINLKCRYLTGGGDAGAEGGGAEKGVAAERFVEDADVRREHVRVNVGEYAGLLGRGCPAQVYEYVDAEEAKVETAGQVENVGWGGASSATSRCPRRTSPRPCPRAAEGQSICTSPLLLDTTLDSDKRAAPWEEASSVACDAGLALGVLVPLYVAATRFTFVVHMSAAYPRVHWRRKVRLYHGHYLTIVKARWPWILFDDDTAVITTIEPEIPKCYDGSNSGSVQVFYFRAVDLDLTALGFKPATPP